MLAYHGNKITFALLVYINFSLLGPVIIIEKKNYMENPAVIQ